MRIKIRNRILRIVTVLISSVLIAILVWIVFETHPTRGEGIVFVSFNAATVAVAAWVMWRMARISSEADRAMRDIGIEPAEEKPIPIRLAKNRESLIVSIILLVIIAFVFVAYYGGWFHGSRIFRNW